MYCVTLKTVLTARDAIMGLSRTIELPFAPYPGLELLGLTSCPEQPEMLLEVCWNATEGRFHAELEDWFEPEQGIACLIDHFGPKWQLHEPGMDEVEEEAGTKGMNGIVIGQPFPAVCGADWYTGPALWRVHYEYADTAGGGCQVDYFRTVNRSSPPTGPEIRKCLDSERLTVVGIDRVECLITELPGSLPFEPFDADRRDRRIFDLTTAESPQTSFPKRAVG
jgi:hypothetical protein